EAFWFTMVSATRLSQVTSCSSLLGRHITTRTSPRISPCGESSTDRLVARFQERWPKVKKCRLTIVGGDRERSVVTRRGRGRDCAPAALDRALLGGPSTSPLGDGPVSPWLTKRRAYRWAPWISVLLVLAVASAQQSPTPRTERPEEPVIRALEL